MKQIECHNKKCVHNSYNSKALTQECEKFGLKLDEQELFCLLNWKFAKIDKNGKCAMLKTKEYK